MPADPATLARAVYAAYEHGDRAALRDRLDRQHSRHHGAVGKVALEPPAVRRHSKTPAHAATGLELEDLVDEEERRPVRDDRLDRLPPERR